MKSMIFDKKKKRKLKQCWDVCKIEIFASTWGLSKVIIKEIYAQFITEK